MGCDIHCVLELNSSDSKGHSFLFDVSNLLGRDYEVYGHLFGVRGFGEAHFKDRGHPDDITEEAAAIFREVDGFGYSYCTLNELVSAGWNDRTPATVPLNHLKDGWYKLQDGQVMVGNGGIDMPEDWQNLAKLATTVKTIYRGLGIRFIVGFS